MRLTEFLVKEATLDDLRATEKESAIREAVEALSSAKCIKANSINDIVRALMERERLGTTGIGKGVAVPHVKHPSVKRMVGVLARSRKGVPFASLDGEPVYIIFLLVSPQDDASPRLHLKALERISRLIRNDTYLRFLNTAKDREELIRLIEEEDQEILP